MPTNRCNCCASLQQLVSSFKLRSISFIDHVSLTDTALHSGASRKTRDSYSGMWQRPWRFTRAFLPVSEINVVASMVRVSFRNVSECSFLRGNTSGQPGKTGIEPLVEQWQAFLLFAGIGLLTACLAKMFNFIRKSVYLDKVSFNGHFVNYIVRCDYCCSV